MQVATFRIWPDARAPSPGLRSQWPLGTGRDILSARQVRRGGRMSDDRKGAMAPDPVQWIVAIAERRDRAAFVALFEFYAPRVKSMLMRLGVGAETAEDIAQDTLLAVWGKAAQYDPARASGVGLDLRHRAQFADRPSAPRPASEAHSSSTKASNRRSRSARTVRSMRRKAMRGCARPLANCPMNKCASSSFLSSRAAPMAISRNFSICRSARSNRGFAWP